MVLLGHWRSGRLRGGNLLYFVEGSLSLRVQRVRTDVLCRTNVLGRLWFVDLHRHFGERWETTQKVTLYSRGSGQSFLNTNRTSLRDPNLNKSERAIRFFRR